MKIFWKLVIVIFAVQFLLCFQETLKIDHCHRTGHECWEWFLIMMVNFPASILAANLIGTFNTYLGFYPQLITLFLLYVFFGTLWWSLLTHSAAWTFLWIARTVRGRTNTKPSIGR